MMDLDALELLLEENKNASWLVTMKELRPLITELRASREAIKKLVYVAKTLRHIAKIAGTLGPDTEREFNSALAQLEALK